MRKSLKVKFCSLFAAAALALTACGSSSSDSDGENKPDYEVLNDLDQYAITNAMGMGWNLGNQLEANSDGHPSETAWGNPTVTEELIKEIKNQGFKTVRIPVSYLDKIGKETGTINEDWLNRVQEVVDYVVKNDMFAIINIHGDGYYTVKGAWLLCNDDNQDEIKTKYANTWRQIAEKFKDYDEHLIFESMNEEFNNQYGKPVPEAYANINAYNQIFVDTVRETGGNNTKRWLLMPGWNTNIDYTCSDYGFTIPQDTKCDAEGKRLMISVHYYDPYNFTLDENEDTAKTQWGKYAVENYDNWGQEDHVDAQMTKLQEWFTSAGYPVVIGELGVQDKSYLSSDFAGFRNYWTEYVVKSAKLHGCIPIYWDNGYNGGKGFGIIDRTTYEITQPELIEAMMRAINSEGDYTITPPAGFETERAA